MNLSFPASQVTWLDLPKGHRGLGEVLPRACNTLWEESNPTQLLECSGVKGTLNGPPDTLGLFRGHQTTAIRNLFRGAGLHGPEWPRAPAHTLRAEPGVAGPARGGEQPGLPACC